ncbi:MAG: LamG-like jellyroll fold domain-containing protein [Planctomycetota bacterium]|nr:LamG-like jellyroll fold domain-containing protein [Planctomycetota bacterium]
MSRLGRSSARRFLSMVVALGCCAWAAVGSAPGQGEGEPVHAGTDSAVDLRAPAERDGFSFVVFGDRTGGPPEGISVLEEGVRMANRLDPDFVMTVGDMIQGYNEAPEWLTQMHEYQGVMADLRAPWYPVLGNHDVYARGRPPGGHKELYKRHFGPLYYSFDYRWAHIVCLSSDEAQSFRNPSVNQNMSSEQLDWLRADLEASEAEQVFVFLHHPRWTGSYDGCNWPEVHEVLVADGRCTAVFAGHTHRWVDYGVRDGIRYLVLGRTGGAAGTLLESSSMHVVTHVRARREGITLGVMQTGSLFGGDMVSADELREMGRLSKGGWLSVEGSLSAFDLRKGALPLRLTVTNPTGREVGWALARPNPSSFWRVSLAGDGGPLGGRLAPGASANLSISVRPLTSFEGAVPPDHPALLATSRPLPEAELELTYSLGSGLEQTFQAVRRLPISPPGLSGETGSAPAGEGRVLELDGASALRVDLDEDLDQLTVECWVRGPAPKERAGLVCRTEQSGFGIFWRDSGGESAVPRGMVYVEGREGGGAEYAVAGASEPWEFGEWTHLALSHDGSRVRFFVNGTLTGEAAGGEAFSNGLPLFIGADTDGQANPVSFFEGQVDEVRVSRRARYRLPFQPSRILERDVDTVLLLHLDRQVGGFHPDDSGGARHAWPVGSPRLVRAQR